MKIASEIYPFLFEEGVVRSLFQVILFLTKGSCRDNISLD